MTELDTCTIRAMIVREIEDGISVLTLDGLITDIPDSHVICKLHNDEAEITITRCFAEKSRLDEFEIEDE